MRLRDDLKSGELPLAVFAADLYDVVMQKGHRPVYEQPAPFFALTYPALNLRELVKDVALRLAGHSDKAYRKLAVNYGGGKTHTLIALRHLVHDPGGLPDLPAVREFEAHVGFKPPRSRVAALCFDKIDIETGVATPGPDWEVRKLRYPWSVLAWQLAGSDGLRMIHAAGQDAERETPPAEPLLVELLAQPQSDGLSTLVLLDEVLMYLRVRVRDYLGWEEVRAQLQDQPIDPVREQMLAAETAAARKRMPDAVRSAYCVVVTVSESDAIHAFRVVIGDEPLFTTIKADRRSRIQETAISAEAMLPGGPYDLWREDEQARRVKDLVGAFAQFPKLPKMLRTKEILDTVLDGVRSGIWVARLARPDRTIRTLWRTGIDEQALADAGLELVLPEAAKLSALEPDLIRQDNLPGLWSSDTITVQDLYDYFAGGREVVLPREGYEETLRIPECEAAQVEAAVLQAVEQGLVWLTNGPASILNEPVPVGVLSAAAILRPPPERIPIDEMMAESIPDAWRERHDQRARRCYGTLDETWCDPAVGDGARRDRGRDSCSLGRALR